MHPSTIHETIQPPISFQDICRELDRDSLVASLADHLGRDPKRIALEEWIERIRIILSSLTQIQGIALQDVVKDPIIRTAVWKLVCESEEIDKEIERRQDRSLVYSDELAGRNETISKVLQAIGLNTKGDPFEGKRIVETTAHRVDELVGPVYAQRDAMSSQLMMFQ